MSTPSKGTKKKRQNDGDIRSYFSPRTAALTPRSIAVEADPPRQVRRRLDMSGEASGTRVELQAVASASSSTSATKRILFPDDRKPPPNLKKKPVDWTRRHESLIEKFGTNEYLLEHHLGQVKWEQERATASQPRQGEKPPQINVQMSVQQMTVVDHPPDIPLSVRAGAGTGKTHTMVARAVQLKLRYGLDASRILMLTFTNRAAGEMRERIRAEFEKLFPDEEVALPTVKTFHSLAYSWVRNLWRQCGLGRYPTLLATKTQQNRFMKKVLEEHLKQLQLERCYDLLDLPAATTSSRPSWDFVISTMETKFPEAHARAQKTAKEKIAEKTSKTRKNESKTTTPSKRKPSAKQLAAEKRKAEELNLLARSKLQRECYLELLLENLIQKKCDLKAQCIRYRDKCDLEVQWTRDTDQCNLYLKLVENARLGQHHPTEYLPEDAAILRRYEATQEKTGNIDFDKLLQSFVNLLQNNEEIAQKFRTLYNYVIVDEYQDNSEVQSKLLLSMVTDGRVTVVGDDDQCIYQFRGASPGNFDAFAQHYKCSTPVVETVLEENYRSTGNILAVAATFLDGAHKREPKTLRPTRESGSTVELWKCMTAVDQARQIAVSIKDRHDNGNGVSLGQVACMFRCFQMGRQQKLHKALQLQLAQHKIPFKVVGGQSFLASEKCSDILAYIRLTLTGTPDRVDDEAFLRVLNKPPRRIGKQVQELIKAHHSQMDDDTSARTNDGTRHRSTGLEEAAIALICEHNILSDSQKQAVKGFFDLLHQLRVAALRKTLPELVDDVWSKTGLADWHEKRDKRKSHDKEQEEAEDDEDFEGNVGEGIDSIQRKEKNHPEPVQGLLTVARAHIDEWKASDSSTDVESLFYLAKKCVIEHVEQLPEPELPQRVLPQYILDDLYMPGGIGLPVVSSFLADLALQTNIAEDGTPDHEDDRVTISTVHRAKGLEWQDVYVPFFNEGYMPTQFRENSCPQCSAGGVGGKCSLKCARYYAKLHAQRRGMTPEKEHNDEERRLAHVAATRAKDRLVFVSTERDNTWDPCFPSSFSEPCLGSLPSPTFQRKDKW